MYRCCIFDLDGTLLNTLPALIRTMNLTLGHFDLQPIGEEDTKRFVGDGYKKFVERAFKARGVEARERLEAAYPVYERYFRDNCLYHIEAYDGIRELLAFLKARGTKIAVVSNKGQERAEENIESVFGRGYFDMILGEREGIARKPDPAGALCTARVLGAEPSECLYLGDTDTDMKTGIAAGMDTAGVTWGFRGREELLAFHPRYIVDDPRQVMEIMGT